MPKTKTARVSPKCLAEILGAAYWQLRVIRSDITGRRGARRLQLFGDILTERKSGRKRRAVSPVFTPSELKRFGRRLPPATVTGVYIETKFVDNSRVYPSFGAIRADGKEIVYARNMRTFAEIQRAADKHLGALIRKYKTRRDRLLDVL